jgi:hypothetical protein
MLAASARRPGRKKLFVLGRLHCWGYCWPTALRLGTGYPVRRIAVDPPSNDNDFNDRWRFLALRQWHRGTRA